MHSDRVGDDPPVGNSEDRRARVLLADDHQPMLDRAVALLTSEFAVVAALSDGEAAVLEALRLHPDVLVLDISMPHVSGLEAAARLRLAGSDAPIVFLTVHLELEFVHAAWEAGGLGYVSKSHMGTDLIPAVRAALSGHRFVSASLGPRDAA